MDFDEQTCLVDQILDYSNLDRELAGVFEKLNIPFEGSLRERSKSNLRPDRRHYRDVYSEDQAERVRSAFKREIELHGFSY
jgi:hypothetical protein